MKAFFTNHGSLIDSSKPDPYAELKKAHAEGKKMEYFDGAHWNPIDSPSWICSPDHYRIKPEPAFQLPPPPPGMQWHREDGWKAEDLPPGTRPIVLWEKPEKGDECFSSVHRYEEWEPVSGLIGAAEEELAEHTVRTTRPLTFTHAGKTWTWHRPGDPMPCDGEARIEIISLLGKTTSDDGTLPLYPRAARSNIWEQTLGWRYADEKKTVPLGPEDVPPCCAFRRQNESSDYIMPTSVYVGGIYGHDEIVFRHTWEYLKEQYEINRSIPLTGKWNPDAWEPCSKEVDA